MAKNVGNGELKHNDNNNLVPRVYSAFKMAAVSRHLESGVDPGNEVAITIYHFTVECLVAWPLNESEAGGDLVFVVFALLTLFSC